MRKLISYIATSLDGKIAKSDGSVDWLNDSLDSDGPDYGYAAFNDSIDTIIMGNSTYMIGKALSETFPSPDKKNFVLTRNSKQAKNENVTYFSKNPERFVKALKKENGKDIWLMGGSEINSLMLNVNLIDELRLYVIPIALGKGIPLFSKSATETKLTLTSSQSYSNGVVELIYHIK